MALPSGGLPLSSQNAKVRINGAVLVATDWSVDPKTEWRPASNFEGTGFKEQAACLSECRVQISGWYNAGAGQNMHEGGLGIVDGAELANVRLYLANTIGPFWSLPHLDVESVRCTAKVDDLYKYEISGMANGAFAYPTGDPD